MKIFYLNLLLAASLFAGSFANASPDLEINTPAITAIKNSMHDRHNKLGAFYSSGAVGLTKSGLVAVKDAKAVPLKERGSLNALVQAENADRTKLYQEIANANGHPEWKTDIQSTFAARWVSKAKSGWFYQGAGGWAKK